ncbi:MAG: GNAT family N-acetyltransferase [Pseudomonadota bacterium]
MTPEHLAQIHHAAFRDARPWTAAEFQTLLAADHTHLTAHAYGFALWRAIAGEAELLTLAVAPDHQGQGIGGRVMRTWMGDAAALADSAFLEVAADNISACALYARHSFVEVARRPGYYRRPDGHAAQDAVVMRAALPFIVP